MIDLFEKISKSLSQKLKPIEKKIKDIEDVIEVSIVKSIKDIENVVEVTVLDAIKNIKLKEPKNGVDGKNGRDGKSIKGEKGDKGEQGVAGISIKGEDGIGFKDANVNEGGDLIISRTDGQIINAGNVKGEKGETLIQYVQQGGGSTILKAGDIQRLTETVTADNNDEIAIVRSGGLLKIKKSNLVTGGAGSSAFNDITSGTNTTAAMIVSTGATLAASGSGTIDATSTTALKSATTTIDVSASTAPTSGQILTATSGTTATWQNATGGSSFSALTSGTNTTAAMVVSTGASLAATGSGTIVATSTTGNAATVTTNANLTGPITSVGNATTIADAELAAIAGLTSAANKVPRFTGSGTADLLDFVDEDDMISNSATAVPSQQSVKAYVDNSITTYTNQTYVFADIASSIGGYYQAVSLSLYATAAVKAVTAALTTTPAIMATFATNVNFPNVTSIPVGDIIVHYDTQKAAGSNNYYTYAEIYKRVLAGTETLLLTTDVSTQTAVNTVVSTTVTAINPTIITLLSTDRIVVKVYGVMASSTASVDIRFDDATSARVELPTVATNANLVPYTGATQNVDLGSFTATSTGGFIGNSTTATALATARTIGGVSFNGTANITVSTATGGFTVSGGDLSIGANNIAITGSIGSTGSRSLKGWFTDLQVTNAIAGSITGNAATVTTNANLTGDVTSVGNATTIAAGAIDIAMHSATGTPSASTYYRGDNTWATVVGGSSAFTDITTGTNTTAAMVVGTGASLAATGSGTIVATSTTGNAATVTTNANLTGAITSVGNATSLGSFTSLELKTALTDETGSGAAVFGTNPTLDAPVINNLPTGTGVSSSSVASTLVSRGSTQNSFANAFVNKATNTTSSAGTTVLTTSSARIYTLTGTNTHTHQLPDATNLTTGATYIFNNDSTGAWTITNDGGGTLVTIPTLGAATLVATSISTANGAWTVRNFIPAAASVSGANTGDQNLFSTIAVSGQSDVVADSTSDTLTLAAGANITITTNAGTDTVTIASTGGATLGDGNYGDIVVSGSGTVMTVDLTVLDVFTSALNGLTPLSGGGTTNFLRADGTWAAPSGGGGGGVKQGQVNAILLGRAMN